MYKLKSIEEFINEAGMQEHVYRNTSYKWLLNLLKRKRIKADKKRFISFSLESDSGGQDNFGGTRIIFNRNVLEKQGLIEIFYEPEFFEMYPDISRYVTGYESEAEYYSEKEYEGKEEAWQNHDLGWEDIIQDYEPEQELVIKSLKLTPDLIEHVEFVKDKPNKKLLDLLDKLNIEYV